ncbi:hypothetical protein [Candidatus Amarolinea dominans]|uniref:hypothetical protein n=1 Tax=Candidatus Amarolinea dominans TaxID=3140696 RepID=UPI0031350F3B|nr:hypothetical protein [Anaerolineae bacterium]
MADTSPSARAACLGFWSWHQKNARDAADAFAQVDGIRFGAELSAMAAAIAAGLETETLADLSAWQTNTQALDTLPAPALRPGTLAALRVLRQAADDARVAQQASGAAQSLGGDQSRERPLDRTD